MKVTVEKQEGNKIHLQIEVEGSGIAKRYREVLNQQGRNLKVKGFRKGKVPPQLIEQYVDTDRLRQEIFQTAMTQSYQQAISQQQIEAIAEPDIQAIQVEIGKPFIYRAVVEVRPEVVLGAYQDLTVHVPPQEEASEEKVQEQLDFLRREHAVLIPVDDRAARMGDLVSLRIEGTIEGEPIDLGESKDMTLELREDSFVKGFSDHIVGMEVDGHKEFTLTFPEDYYVEDLRDKPITFNVHLQEIKEVELAELDDDLASTVDNELESLDALQERIRGELEESLEEQFEIVKQQRVLDKVVASASVEIPDSMMNRELFAMWQMSEGNQLMSAKVNEKTLQASWLHWMQRGDMQSTARQRIKTTLVLGAIARAESLQLSPEEIEEEIQELASAHNVPVEQVKQQLQQDNRMVALMDELLSYKIIDWVMDHNEILVTDKADELEALDQSIEAAEAVAEVAHEVADSPDSTAEDVADAEELVETTAEMVKEVEALTEGETITEGEVTASSESEKVTSEG
ncbi:MAG: trigger factor [Candidatus Sericytochromatia bacterium]